jgi:hypothetical protein
MKVRIENINPNIGHFLHQQLQYLIHLLFTQKDSIILFLPPYITMQNEYRWHYGILSVMEKKNDKFSLLITEEKEKDVDRIISPGHPMIIDLSYITYLRDITFSFFSIDINEKNKKNYVLYTRQGDTNRRHILNSEAIKDHFDTVLISMNMSFEEQVKCFSKMTHFVSVESGAHFVNIMFMKPNSRVMNILTRTEFLDDRKESYDSWQVRFGTSSLIEEFNFYSKSVTRQPCSDGASCGDHDMHDHVVVDDKLKKDILIFLYKDRYVVVRHPGYHGFFSYCNMALIQLMRYFSQRRVLPLYLDMSEMFTFFKTDEGKDISSLFFSQKIPIEHVDYKLETMTKDLQFTNYKEVDMEIVNPIFSQYFIPAKDIYSRGEKIMKKYNVDPSKTTCIFYRGLDKSTETTLPSYQEVMDKVKRENAEGPYLLQSDETEFFSYFSSLTNAIIFQDEIKHVRKQRTSINHMVDMETKLELVKNFLAIVLIMSKCKKIFFISGNISLWITLFRGHTNGIHQYLNGEWY